MRNFKDMFKNVSTQDLLSDSQRSSSYSNDSALFSLSQRQQSQSDFSQVRTQDLFTQNHTSGSQSESSFPASKKVSMYDKWMSKGAMFRKEPMKTAGSICPQPNQQQYQLNMNRTKDPEERELMQQVVNIVQDCNKEVKSTLTAVRDKLESGTEFSAEKLSDTMKAFLEDVWKHEERMLQAIEEGKNNSEKAHQLEKQLAAKDAVIKQLQSQLEESDKARDVKQVAKAVREEMLSPHLAVENKLMEILEVTREASEQHSEQLNQYHSQLASQAKDYKEWKTANQKIIKDMGKRLQKDISSLRKELQKDEGDWHRSVQEQLAEACSTHHQDMEQLIDKAVADITSATSRQGSHSAAASSTVVTALKKELQAVLQRQTKSTEKNLQAMWQQQTLKQQQQVQHLHQTLLALVTDCMQSLAEQLHEKHNEDVDTRLTVPAFEEKIEEYHADIKKQLEEMYRHHVEEVKRLQKDASFSDSVAASGSALRSFSSNTSALSGQSVASDQGGFPKTTGYPLKRRGKLTKISPLSKQDRASLFCKAKPSPVVAVLPQPQPVQTSSVFIETNSPVGSDSGVTLQQQRSPAANLHTKVTTSKKRKGSKGRKKCSAKKRKAARKVTVTQQIENSCPQRRKGTTREQLAVYNFSDQHSPDQGRPLLKSFQLPVCEEQRNEVCSPSASTESWLSSPAMSVTVDTEMVWVRRSRWQSNSAPRQIRPSVDSRPSNMYLLTRCPGTIMQDDVVADQLDMLSSPFGSSTTATQTSLPQLKLEAGHTNFSRTRSGMKRLC